MVHKQKVSKLAASGSPLLMENIYSNEYYENLRNPLSNQQVLRDINFIAEKGECWSIFGSSIFELRLLLEIMANAKSYAQGRLLIGGLDTTMKNGTVLPYLFYIGSTNMAFGNMNLLEYLMFITINSKKSAVSRQEYLLDFLLDSSLGYISLTPISILTPQEKSLVILTAAVLSDSKLVIMNLPRLKYEQNEIESLRKLVLKLRHMEKTLIFNTEYPELAQAISTNFCYLYKGQIIYMNSLSNFLNEFDRVIYTIGADNIDYIIQNLKTVLPQFEYKIAGNSIQVIDKTFSFEPGNRLFSALGACGLKPAFVSVNNKNIKNAIEEMMRLHDIQ